MSRRIKALHSTYLTPKRSDRSSRQKGQELLHGAPQVWVTVGFIFTYLLGKQASRMKSITCPKGAWPRHQQVGQIHTTTDAGNDCKRNLQFERIKPRKFQHISRIEVTSTQVQEVPRKLRTFNPNESLSRYQISMLHLISLALTCVLPPF